VEWCYDGLGGRVIEWTHENGSSEKDPSVLAYVVGRDGKVFAGLHNGQQVQAHSLVKWARAQLEAYEKAHPSTRLPFRTGHVTRKVSGAGDAVVCAELEAARQAGQPILLYFGRSGLEPNDKAARKQARLSRSFEKGALNSKGAAKQAAGWALIRLDLADPLHRALAEILGVKAAPELLMWLPGQERGRLLGHALSGSALALQLKKHRPQ